MGKGESKEVTTKTNYMKHLLLLLTMTIALVGTQSCKVYNAVKSHSSVSLSTPKKITDPVTLVFKLWGGQDMLNSFVPAESKFGVFLKESEKYCTFRIVEYPIDGNDTIALALKCESDSITKRLAGLVGK